MSEPAAAASSPAGAGPARRRDPARPGGALARHRRYRPAPRPAAGAVASYRDRALRRSDGREVWVALAASLARVAAGFALGALAGIGLGLTLGLWRPAREAVAPTLHAGTAGDALRLIPLLTAWFGNGEAAKVAFIALSTFFPLYLNTEQGLRTVPVAYREVARARLPCAAGWDAADAAGALPQILIGVEVALLSAWIGTIGSEYMLGTGRGLDAFLAARQGCARRGRGGRRDRDRRPAGRVR